MPRALRHGLLPRHPWCGPEARTPHRGDCWGRSRDRRFALEGNLGQDTPQRVPDIQVLFGDATEPEGVTDLNSQHAVSYAKLESSTDHRGGAYARHGGSVAGLTLTARGSDELHITADQKRCGRTAKCKGSDILTQAGPSKPGQNRRLQVHELKIERAAPAGGCRALTSFTGEEQRGFDRKPARGRYPHEGAGQCRRATGEPCRVAAGETSPGITDDGAERHVAVLCGTRDGEGDDQRGDNQACATHHPRTSLMIARMLPSLSWKNAIHSS